MNWSDIRSELRVLLRDPDSKRWSDDDLLQFFNSALGAISTWYPRLNTQDIAAETVKVALPPSFISVRGIRAGSDLYNELGYGSPWYTVDSMYLYLSENANGVTAVFAEEYDRVTNDSDDVALPAAVRDAAEKYACYAAQLPYGVTRAQLAQWPAPGEPKVGNPLNVEADMWYKAYEAAKSEWLNRHGR